MTQCQQGANDNFDRRTRQRNDSFQGEFVHKQDGEGASMARSVRELRLESERTRAALAATVDQLRERISDTAEDLRQKVSPQHIKSEVADYIGQTTQGWLGALQQRAMDNPLQAVAAGTAVAVPLLRLARGTPLPLLMIAAGLALTSKTMRDRAVEAAAPAMDKAGEALNQTVERAQAMAGNIMDTVSSAQGQASEMANDAQNRVTKLADDLSNRMAATGGAVTDNLKSGVDAAKDTVDRARSATNDMFEAARNSAAAAPEKARRIIGENAILIGGLGAAIGAIIAAALPKTEAEATVMGEASDSAKQAAKEATESGFEAVKNTTMSVADAAMKSIAESDLGAHATRMTGNLAESLKEAAQDVVSAAFDPFRTPKT